MAVVQPKSDLPARLRGLHLFHYGGAPCAQRVRFVLAEKGIRRGPEVPWESDAPDHLEAPPGTYVGRPVSLPRKQNLTPAYAAIHPNMVVPALVHDGVLHIESVDVMRYVDEALPGPPLVPRGAEPACRALVEHAAELQTAVRHVTFRWSLGGFAKLSRARQEELERLDAPDSPDRISEFYGRFSNDRIPESAFVAHVEALERGFSGVEERLGRPGATWLCGETFSMADIIWTVKMQRIHESGYPFAERFPALWDWFSRVRARPTFREAIWRDVRVSSRIFRAKGAVQNFLRRGLRVASQATRDGSIRP